MTANSVAPAYKMVDWSMPESMRVSLISGKSAAGLSPEALERRVCGYERQNNKILLSGVRVRRDKEGSASCEYSGSRWVRTRTSLVSHLATLARQCSHGNKERIPQ